jgi:hypothetical protein
MSVDVEQAKRMARKRAASIRVVGVLPAYDITILENRNTGERRRVPNKFLLFANNNLAVAFELAPPDPTFADEQPSLDEE